MQKKTLRGFDENGKAIYCKANKGKVIGEFVCNTRTESGINAGRPVDFGEVIRKIEKAALERELHTDPMTNL